MMGREGGQLFKGCACLATISEGQVGKKRRGNKESCAGLSGKRWGPRATTNLATERRFDTQGEKQVRQMLWATSQQGQERKTLRSPVGGGRRKFDVTADGGSKEKVKAW